MLGSCHKNTKNEKRELENEKKIGRRRRLGKRKNQGCNGIVEEEVGALKLNSVRDDLR